MKFLVTGLCMRGNKGGPAIALSLNEQLKRYLPEASFTYAVPGGQTFAHEQQWAQYYGVDVIEELSPHDFIPRMKLQTNFSNLRRFRTWFATLQASDALLEMSAISYAGPPARSSKYDLSRRFRFFLLCQLARKKLLAWTQSYGPFSTPLVRAMASLDLRQQPIIFCRGDICRAEVKQLLPNKEAHSYPDVAVTLPYERAVGYELVQKFAPLADFSKLVTISPSAVIHSKTHQRDDGLSHLDLLSAFCQRLIGQGWYVLIVPHTYHPQNPNPLVCDHALSVDLSKRLPTASHGFVDSDLSPVDLKSIISTAHIHIGGRYHSIIAALSSSVPCISLAWHSKYQDIMQMYGVEEYTLDSMNVTSIEQLDLLFDKIVLARAQLAEQLTARQQHVITLVDENVRCFVEHARRISA